MKIVSFIGSSDEVEGDGVDLGGGVGDGVDLGGGVGDGVDLEGDDLGGGVGDGDDFDTITPKVGMEFLTQEDAYKFYNRYALKMGFGSRWSSTSKSRTDRDLVISRIFVCSKEGKRRPLKKPIVDKEVHHSRETRVECKAMMKILRTKSGSWRVGRFVPEHNNHELSTPSKAIKHRSHKKVHRQPVVKNLITQLHSEGIPNASIARVVNAFEPCPQHMITPQQVHDHLRVDMSNNVGDSEVDCDLYWVIRYKCNKALEIAYKSPNFADEYNRFLTKKLVEYDNFVEPEGVDVPSQGLNSQVDPIAPPLSQNSCNFISEINICDPTASARHKGRPRLPSRLQFGLEVSQEETTKKRKTCRFCGEKGHYRTGCSKAKANDVACRGQSAPGGSQALPRTH